MGKEIVAKALSIIENSHFTRYAFYRYRVGPQFKVSSRLVDLVALRFIWIKLGFGRVDASSRLVRLLPSFSMFVMLVTS